MHRLLAKGSRSTSGPAAAQTGSSVNTWQADYDALTRLWKQQSGENKNLPKLLSYEAMECQMRQISEMGRIHGFASQKPANFQYAEHVQGGSSKVDLQEVSASRGSIQHAVSVI